MQEGELEAGWQRPGPEAMEKPFCGWRKGKGERFDIRGTSVACLSVNNNADGGRGDTMRVVETGAKRLTPAAGRRE